jgi:hypothetical protein
MTKICDWCDDTPATVTVIEDGRSDWHCDAHYSMWADTYGPGAVAVRH